MAVAESSTKFVDLVPNKGLLDPNFDGYKLSLDTIPTKFCDLKVEVDERKPSDSQWSLQHLRLFAAHNHLHLDTWQPCCAYVLLSDGGIYGVSFEATMKVWVAPRRVAHVATGQYGRASFNASLHFVSPSLAVVADGASRLLFFNTGDRAAFDTWQVVGEVAAPSPACVLVDAAQRADGAVSCLLETVVERVPPGARTDESAFVSVFHWLDVRRSRVRLFGCAPCERVAVSSDGGVAACRSRSFETRGNVEAAFLSRADADVAVVASSRSCQFTFDSAAGGALEPPTAVSAGGDTAEVNGDKRAFCWSQTATEVVATMTLDSAVQSDSVAWLLTESTLRVQVIEQLLFDGQLHHSVDTDASTWALVDAQPKCLQMRLIKRVHGHMWSEFLKGDTRWKYTSDDLSTEHSTNVEMAPADSAEQPFNAQQLEQCDEMQFDGLQIFWLDGVGHTVSHEADVGGHQFLFVSRQPFNAEPLFCLRHDVDGVLWALGAHEGAHVATFHALGYVQASKERRKFAACADDFSLAAIADDARHVYVYWQPAAIASDLRNRRTGTRVQCTSRQQLLVVDDADPLIGFAVLPNLLLVLTARRLHAAVLVEADEALVT